MTNSEGYAVMVTVLYIVSKKVKHRSSAYVIDANLTMTYIGLGVIYFEMPSDHLSIIAYIDDIITVNVLYS